MANKNTNFKNRLVLCLAHRPLQPNELDNLISEAVTSSHNYKAELEQEQAKGLHASTNNEQKENTPNSNTTQIEMSASYKNLNPTVHCLITGSPDVSAPGKSFDDWETRWTPGERILSKFIEKIGLQNFHRLPKQGEVRLNGKLVDVKQKNFEIYTSEVEQLMKEYTWIAENVKQHFNLYATKAVSEAVVLCPSRFEGDNEEMVDLAHMLQEIFDQEWTKKEGPLHGVVVKVKTVGC